MEKEEGKTLTKEHCIFVITSNVPQKFLTEREKEKGILMLICGWMHGWMMLSWLYVPLRIVLRGALLVMEFWICTLCVCLCVCADCDGFMYLHTFYQHLLSLMANSVICSACACLAIHPTVLFGLYVFLLEHPSAFFSCCQHECMIYLHVF